MQKGRKLKCIPNQYDILVNQHSELCFMQANKEHMWVNGDASWFEKLDSISLT